MNRFAVHTCVVFIVMAVLVQTVFTERYACYAGVSPGATYVDTRGLTRRDAKKIGKPLYHPYDLSDGLAARVLSSIYYGEKGLFKSKKKKRRAVFTSTEVRNLAPLVADAFSRATDKDYVIIHSAAKRALLSDLHTYCMLFVTDNGLNVAFSSIRQRLSYNVTESEKARIEKIFAKPVDTKKSSFWEIFPVQVEGQRLKKGHKNWLIVDLGALAAGKPVARVEPEEVTPGYEVYSPSSRDDGLEERVRRLERMQGGGGAPRRVPTDDDSYIRVDIARDYVPDSPPPPATRPGPTVEDREREEMRGLGIKEKLKRLRSLRDEGLITDDDYRVKKAHLIRQEQKDKSIREKLKELRDMRDEGLITEKDYESLKKELLDKWF